MKTKMADVLIKNLNKSTKKTDNPIKKKRITLKTKKPLQDKPKSPNPILKKRIAAKTKNPRLDMPESRNSIIIKNRNTPEQNIIKNEISNIVSKGDTDIIPQLTRIKSYSPLVNQEFVTNNEDRADIFKCANSFNDLLLKYTISVGKYKNGRPKCKSLNSQEAKDMLMNNLNNKN